MPATLLTGAAGQGKTQDVILRVKALLNERLFTKIWVLLPTELQINAFRMRLLDELGVAAHFGVEFFDLYDLYSRVLEIAGTPQRQVKDAARFRILRYVLSEVGDQLQHFSAIADTTGFVALIAAFIVELKQAEITPEQFTEIAVSDKDRDVALIYAGYQELLRGRNLVDRDGEGWLALAVAKEKLPLGVDLLLVDGYDQFNPVQARLLARLTEHIDNVVLTLTYQQERAETAHRRFAQTRTRLLESAIWQEMSLDEAAPAIRQGSLAHLSASLFDINPRSFPDDGSLLLVEAPDRLREVQTVLRRVKRLLLNGTAPEQIAIVARSLAPYNAYFLETAPAYGIPLAVKRGTPLAENPAIASILSMIDLAAEDFPRRNVIDVLHSPYLACPDLTDGQVEKLDRVSRGRIVVRGRDNWLGAIIASGHLELDEDGELPTEALTPEEASALYDSADNFFSRITPPNDVTARSFVRWLEGLIGPDPDAHEEESTGNATWADASFNVIRRIRAGNEPEIIARDLAALDCLKRLFLEVLSAYELVDPYEPIAWETFRADLQVAIDNAVVNPARSANHSGRVLLSTVFEARGLPHDHIFLLGLAEGEFPARVVEDAIYTDDERRAIRAQGLPLLTQAEAADESSLFYEITALAHRSLTISRPYIDDKGNDWPASPYWRAVMEVVQIEKIERLPIETSITLDDAARLSEAMIALAQKLGGKLTDEHSGVHNWLIGQDRVSAAWLNALRGRSIEVRRVSAGMVHDNHTGHLSDPAMLDRVAQLLGTERLWSASQFNEYGTCPYKFFARRLLRLEALKEPEEGMDQLQFGTLVHEILEHTYRQISFAGLSISPENRGQALEILEANLDRYLSDAPQRHGFRATVLWQHEQETLRRKLRSLVQNDFAEDSPVEKLFNNGSMPRYSIRQEVRFGWDNQQPIILDGAAGPLRVRGAIDRVDEVDGQVVVIDYKTGSSGIPTKEMVEGRNVQMMLYIAAAQQILPDQVIGGAFWHTGTRKLSGDITPDADEIEQARESLHERIATGRKGIFVNTPSKRTTDGHCSHYCEFSQLCRVERGASNKDIRA